MNHKVNKNWAEKTNDYVKKYPLVILFTLLVFFISSFITISDGVGRLRNFYYQSVNWKITEEKKINSLTAGMNIQKFEDIFGSSDVVTDISENYTEFMFKNKGYWVQAISEKNGTVMLYAITVCDEDFYPRIMVNPGINTPIVGKTTYSQVTEQTPIPHYFLGNTSTTYFIDEAYLGNQGLYQTVYWGINNTCPYKTKYFPDVHAESNKLEDGTVNINSPEIKTFRENTPINMFAVSTFISFPSEILENPLFVIGGEKNTIRVVPE